MDCQNFSVEDYIASAVRDPSLTVHDLFNTSKIDNLVLLRKLNYDDDVMYFIIKDLSDEDLDAYIQGSFTM